jgi:transcriptional regulator with XRE-family HTH domain
MGRTKGIQEELKALRLGSKIRALRRQRGLTLQDVSNRTGLSKPLLSQIENDLASPPIATLLKISKALGVSIGYFFQEVPASERIVVVRRQQRSGGVMVRIQEEAGKVAYRYEALAYPRSDKQMEPFLVEIEPRAEEDLLYYHKGEEFLYVLSGKVEFRAAEEVHTLGPGDSLYFDSDIPHAIRAVGKGKAKALVVVYSPQGEL